MNGLTSKLSVTSFGTMLLVLLMLFSVVPNSHAKVLKESKYWKEKLTVKGKERSYYVYLPKGMDTKKKYPAVIAFHGFESDANGLKWLIKPEKMADKYKYILILPNAIKKSWNVGKGFGSANKTADEKSFMGALFSVIKARHQINPKKIYTMGLSNGAQMSAMLACNFSDKIAAAAMVAHTFNAKQCKPKYKVPMALLHGVKDTIVPINGGGKYKLRSHNASVAMFKAINGVGSVKDRFLDKPTAKCDRYQNKAKNAKVIACKLLDAGHSWPGGVEFKKQLFGKVNKEVNANNLLFGFFKPYYAKQGGKVGEKNLKAANALLFKKGASNKGKQTASSGNKGKKKAAAKPKKQAAAKKPKPKSSVFKASYNKGKKKYFYYVQRPTKKKPGGSIVVLFTSNEYSAQKTADMFALKHYANLFNFTFILPQGNWKKTPPLNHFDELFLHQLKDIYPDYTDRMYVMGFSHGGIAAQAMYCNYSYMFTAAATISYAWKNDNCSPTVWRPVMLMTSKKDPIYPYKGDGGKDLLSFRDTVTMVKSDIGSEITRNDYIKGKDHRCGAWKDESIRHSVVECTTDWGGHNLPGAKYKFDKKYGPHVKHFKGAKVAMEFLNHKKHDAFVGIVDR